MQNNNMIVLYDFIVFRKVTVTLEAIFYLELYNKIAVVLIAAWQVMYLFTSVLLVKYLLLKCVGLSE
ncbi:hypothetical protein A9B99_02915 [Mangrovibacter phragmitis]|uniref:Uncharacterized protein n=1 Tax=Mangrovibacter phragmitis TaxID=1691903 RepID=A0A1B7L8K4_9ENTR|nr:hypothetical protein A9B99_02915 [Mangrovibacter phragmitis]